MNLVGRAPLLAWLIAGLVPLASMACSADSSSTDVAEGADTVHPKGNDHPGQLLVTVPAGVTFSSPLGVHADSTPVVIGTPVTLSVGTHRLYVQMSGNLASDSVHIDFEIQSDKGTTIDLAAMSYKYDATGDIVIGLDTLAGTEPTSIYSAVNNDRAGMFKGFLDHDDSNGQTVIHDQLATIVGLPPQLYHYRFGLFDGFDVTLTGGEISKTDVLASPARKSIKITAPSRAFPSTTCSGWTLVGQRQTHGSAQVDTRQTSSFNLPDNKSIIVGEFTASDIAPVSYSIRLTGEANPVPLTLGSPGGSPSIFKMGRIDVSDVAVTQNDGSVVNVHGTYTITRAMTSGGGPATYTAIGCGNAPTNSGVDVPPGTYRVTTNYTTVEAGAKQDVSDITIDP